MEGKALQKWRIRNGYSQGDLARALGVIKLTVTRWENGKRDIPPFLHLALKALPKKGGEIRRGRPALKGSTEKRVIKTKKERQVRK